MQFYNLVQQKDSEFAGLTRQLQAKDSEINKLTSQWMEEKGTATSNITSQ